MFVCVCLCFRLCVDCLCDDLGVSNYRYPPRSLEVYTLSLSLSLSPSLSLSLSLSLPLPQGFGAVMFACGIFSIVNLQRFGDFTGSTYAAGAAIFIVAGILKFAFGLLGILVMFWQKKPLLMIVSRSTIVFLRHLYIERERREKRERERDVFFAVIVIKRERRRENSTFFHRESLYCSEISNGKRP